jgi:hypothetical protein
MVNKDKVRKTKNKSEKVASNAVKMPPEDRLRILANIIVDKIIEEYQLGTLPIRSSTNG